MGLVNVGYLHGLSHVECAGVGSLLAHDEAEKGGFSCAVGADNSHNAALRQSEVEILEEFLFAEGFGEAGGFDYLLAETGAVGNEDFQALLALFLVLVEHTVVA